LAILVILWILMILAILLVLAILVRSCGIYWCPSNSHYNWYWPHLSLEYCEGCKVVYWWMGHSV